MSGKQGDADKMSDAELAMWGDLSEQTAKPEPPAAASAAPGSASASPQEMNLDVILDVPVTVSLEVGRARMPIRNLLQLNQGSVVELERDAGDPFDVYVNGTLIAHGEVVVVNERFGIRLTDVISPSERVKRLK
jgi:flagellar motor switch protein FliN/FliY